MVKSQNKVIGGNVGLTLSLSFLNSLTDSYFFFCLNWRDIVLSNYKSAVVLEETLKVSFKNEHKIVKVNI